MIVETSCRSRVAVSWLIANGSRIFIEDKVATSRGRIVVNVVVERAGLSHRMIGDGAKVETVHRWNLVAATGSGEGGRVVVASTTAVHGIQSIVDALLECAEGNRRRVVDRFR
jgi:hypothetical protein